MSSRRIDRRSALRYLNQVTRAKGHRPNDPPRLGAVLPADVIDPLGSRTEHLHEFNTDQDRRAVDDLDPTRFPADSNCGQIRDTDGEIGAMTQAVEHSDSGG
ncbi:hypothetical protein B1S06_15070 [Rhodopseudomonas palustris]|uniref:Uncharacterized protein n=1 Tax=Rhodopseudomonas palustris (strain ATCC BAA-98 / CGA009) TaxID=258594 RepID=Q6N2D9_RHOPA|nr:hypothetical protein B1S06_15070 [Rhodopseudomonas palustris]CAE29552.1 hypothetical protein RPA4111 [Rhodopseudomonas palustris CGA009]